MKKTIIAALICLSSLTHANMDIWKTEIQLSPTTKAVMMIDPNSADVSKNGKLWSVGLSVHSDDGIASYAAVTSGCDKMQGKMMLFDKDMKPVGSTEPIDWTSSDESLPAIVAKFTCAAAYAKGIIKQNSSI